MSFQASDDDTRWMEGGSDASPELQAALRSLWDEPDDGARVARLEARLAPLLGVVPQPELPSESGLGAGAGGTNGAARSARLLTAGKLAAFLVLAGGVAAITHAVIRRTAPESANVTRAVEGVGPSNAKPMPGPAEPLSETTALAPTVAVSSLATVQAAAPPSAPRREADSTSSIAEEARLLQEARAKVQDSPGQALSLLAAHERRYPRSMLGGEREFFTLQALVRAGRRAEAAERLVRFRASSPSSPYLAAATRAVNGGER